MNISCPEQLITAHVGNSDQRDQSVCGAHSKDDKAFAQTPAGDKTGSCDQNMFRSHKWTGRVTLVRLSMLHAKLWHTAPLHQGFLDNITTSNGILAASSVKNILHQGKLGTHTRQARKLHRVRRWCRLSSPLGQSALSWNTMTCLLA